MSPPPDVDGDFSPELTKRFVETRRELDTLTTNKVTTGPEAGRALALAGDLWRRRETLGEEAARDVTLAVDKIEAQAAHAYVDSIDAAAEHAKLARGLDEAFEALMEEGDERVLYTHSAETALAARDALASVRSAMALASMDTAKLDQKLQTIDGVLAKNARTLIGLNGARRREATMLDADERGAAWWFTARMQCDFLMSLYRLQEERVDITQKHNAAHLATCELCQRDVEASSLAYTPEHVAASSLWRREHGRATAAEIKFMDAHAKGCKDCQRALDALAQPEE